MILNGWGGAEVKIEKSPDSHEVQCYGKVLRGKAEAGARELVVKGQGLLR